MKLRDKFEYFYNKSPIPLATTSLIFKVTAQQYSFGIWIFLYLYLKPIFLKLWYYNLTY